MRVLTGNYQNKGVLDSARLWFRRAVRIARERGWTEQYAHCLISLGTLEMGQYRYSEALRFFIKADSLINEQDIRAVRIYHSISHVYARQQQWDDALEYVRRARKITLREYSYRDIILNRFHEGNILYQRARASKDTADYIAAIDSFRSILADIDGRAFWTRKVFVAHHNIGYLLVWLGRHREALPHIRKALAYYRRHDLSTARATGALARILYHLGRHEDARDTLQLAETLLKEMEDVSALSGLYLGMSIECAKAGDHENAWQYHRKYSAYKDSLLNEETQRTISDMSAKYEAEQREKQIALLEKDREITQLALERQKEELRVRTLEALKRKQEIGLLEKDREIQSLELLRRDADLARQQAVTERREQEVRLLRKDKDLQASLLERETFRRNATLVGLAALLLVTGLIFWRYREKQRSNRKLERTLGELRRTQDQLIHTEKMATLGELTAGIAHEIKNPLNFVTNFSTVSTEMMEELEQQVQSLGDGDERKAEVLATLKELKGNMSRIHQHGQRADGIVASMLLHARSQKGVRQEADINTLLREAVQLAFHGMRAQVPDFTVEIEEDYGGNIPRIEVIPQEISRVFLNVLSNAFQVVRKRMRHAADEMYAPAVQVRTRQVGDGVEVRIHDNGPGIAADIREKIFQPFFTTKSTGEGTGLGLSLRYDIVVKGHGGRMQVESEEGEYTAFIMTLPETVET